MNDQPAAPLYAYDSVSPEKIPADAAVVLYYADGRYAWNRAQLARFGGARRRAITVLGDPACNIADVETGDMRPEDVPDFIRARREEYGGRSVVYCNRSTLPAVAAVIERFPYVLADLDVWISTLDGTLIAPADYHGPGRLVACQDTRGQGWDRSRVWVRSWPLRAAA